MCKNPILSLSCSYLLYCQEEGSWWGYFSPSLSAAGGFFSVVPILAGQAYLVSSGRSWPWASGPASPGFLSLGTVDVRAVLCIGWTASSIPFFYPWMPVALLPCSVPARNVSRSGRCLQEIKSFLTENHCSNLGVFHH